MNRDSLGVRPHQKANTRILLSCIWSLRGCEKMSAYYLGHSVWDILIGKPEMPNALVQRRRMKVLIRGRGGNCKGGFVFTISSHLRPQETHRVHGSDGCRRQASWKEPKPQGWVALAFWLSTVPRLWGQALLAVIIFPLPLHSVFPHPALLSRYTQDQVWNRTETLRLHFSE